MRGFVGPSRIVASYVDGGSPPVMSTGLPAAQKGGMDFLKGVSRSGGIFITTGPPKCSAWATASPSSRANSSPGTAIP
jgi:hypothetical protein